MGWIHDDENDSSGFHRGFEGGGSAGRTLTAKEIAAAEAAANEKKARFDAAVAALKPGRDAFAPEPPLAARMRPKVMVPVPDYDTGDVKEYALPGSKAIGFAADVYGGEVVRWVASGLAFVTADGAVFRWPFEK